jgi:predicted CopG family antitoxin
MFWHSKKRKQPEIHIVHGKQASGEEAEDVVERERKLQETDELITVILPIIRN